MSGLPLFLGRRKQREAQLHMVSFGYKVNLKFCKVTLIRCLFTGFEVPSAVEGNNSGLLLSTTEFSWQQFYFVSVATVVAKQELLKLRNEFNSNVTRKGQDLFDKELERSSSCTVRPADASGVPFFVIRNNRMTSRQVC